MTEAQHDEEQPKEQPPTPLVHSLGYGAGTMLAAGMVDLLAHLGPTGLVVGGIIAYAAARHGPELVEQVRENLPTLPHPSHPGRRTMHLHSRAAANAVSLTAPWDGFQPKKRIPSSSRNRKHPRRNQPGRRNNW